MTVRVPASEPPPRPGMVLLNLEGYRCERCAYEWVPRGAYHDAANRPRPVTCPRCKSPYWDAPRRNEP